MGLDSYLCKSTKTNEREIKKIESEIKKVENSLELFKDSLGENYAVSQNRLNFVEYLNEAMLNDKDTDVSFKKFRAGVDAKVAKEGKRIIKELKSLRNRRNKLMPKDIGYWRKNWELHEIINCYNKQDDDNCTNIYLNCKQLNAILSCVESHYEGDDQAYTKKVIKSAIKYLEGDKNNERKVFFYSWY